MLDGRVYADNDVINDKNIVKNKSKMNINNSFDTSPMNRNGSKLQMPMIGGRQSHMRSSSKLLKDFEKKVSD